MNLTKSSPSPSKRDKKIVSSQSNKINAWLTKNPKKKSPSSSKNENKEANGDISDITNVESRVSSKKSKLETKTKITEKQLDNEVSQIEGAKRNRKEDEKKWKNLAALGESDNKKAKKKKEPKVKPVKNSDEYKENLKNISPSRNGSTNKIRKSAENEKLAVSLSEEKASEGNTTAKKYRRIKPKPPKSPTVPVGKKLYDIDMWQGSSITSWLTTEEKINSLSEINSTIPKKSTGIEEHKKNIGNSADKSSGIKQTKKTTTDDETSGRHFEKAADGRTKNGKAKKEEVNGSPVKQKDNGKYKRIQSNTVSNWLSKDTGLSKLRSKTDKKQEEVVELDISDKSCTKLSSKVCNAKSKKIDVKIDKVRSETIVKNGKSSKKRSRSKTSSEDDSKSPAWQQRLDSFINLAKDTDVDKQQRQKLKRQTSQNSEFPSFEKVKRPKTNKNSEFFKKYGMRIPSVDEILKEQRDYEKYKTQIESFQAMEDFDLPFSVKDLNVTQAQDNNRVVLGCTHLSQKDLDEAFGKNLTYISDIFRGTKYSERHERFFNNNNNKCYNLSVKDLTYSTSMIVFNYEQKEHLITLLKDKFDPDDKKTSYFFQVLLPELCLKIFMDTHDMTYDQAVEYLETRPILDD